MCSTAELTLRSVLQPRKWVRGDSTRKRAGLQDFFSRNCGFLQFFNGIGHFFESVAEELGRCSEVEAHELRVAEVGTVI